MGKTLGAIVTIAGAAALAYYTGGLATAFGATALAGAGGATAAAAFAAISTLSATFAVTQTLALGADAIGLGPNAPKPETTETAIKTSRPPRVSGYGAMRLYFAYLLYETASNGTAVDVGAVHDGRINAIRQFYLNDDKVTLSGSTVVAGDDGRYGSSINLYASMGLPTETAFSAVTALIPDWDADHRGDGVVTLAMTAAAVKSKDYLQVYPNGVPVASIAAELQLCPDPRVDNWSDPATWTWTENAVRHYLHYIIVREGIDVATKVAPTLDYWKTACDDADSAIALKAGGTEPRYRSCVTHKHTDPHKQTKGAILACFDGWVAPRADGALVIYSGRYSAPDPADLISPDEIVSYDWSGVAVDDDSAVNILNCTYVSADHDYNTVDADPWTDEGDIAERGELSQAFSPQVPSWGQSRRLAKRAMQRTNEPRRGTVTTNVAGRKIRGKRFIPLRIEEAGAVFYDGPAEITALTRNLATGGVTFNWVAADPNIDNWNPSTEEGEPAPIGNRVAPSPLDTPTIISATADFSDVGQSSGTETEDGQAVSGARVLIIADGPDDRPDITWYARWRVGTSAPWNEREYPDADPGPGVSLQTEFVPLASNINVEVAYAFGDGRLSPWSAAAIVDTTMP